jgi:hypothetical protein
MNKEFLQYTEALELKELGFDEPCFRWYDERWGDDLQQDKFNTNKDLFMTDLDCSAPLYQQCWRWFREKYDLHAYVDSMRLTTGETVYSYVIEITDGEESDNGKNWKTYEEAELECLKQLIKIVKDENKRL